MSRIAGLKISHLKFLEGIMGDERAPGGTEATESLEAIMIFCSPNTWQSHQKVNALPQKILQGPITCSASQHLLNR